MVVTLPYACWTKYMGWAVQKKYTLANAERKKRWRREAPPPLDLCFGSALAKAYFFCSGQGNFSCIGQPMFFLHLAHPSFFCYFLLAVARAGPGYF